MQYKRSRRVGELIMQEVSKMILMHEIKDPRIGFATVTNIDMSDDLKNAKIFVSFLGEETEKQESLDGLNNALGYIKKELGKRIKIRHIPKIRFILDTTLEHSLKINRILNELEEEEEEDSSGI